MRWPRHLEFEFAAAVSADARVHEAHQPEEPASERRPHDGAPERRPESRSADPLQARNQEQRQDEPTERDLVGNDLMVEVDGGRCV